LSKWSALLGEVDPPEYSEPEGFERVDLRERRAGGGSFNAVTIMIMIVVKKKKAQVI
jgi:hypothetical protein